MRISVENAGERICQRKYEREGERKTDSEYLRKVQDIKANGRAEI